MDKSHLNKDKISCWIHFHDHILSLEYKSYFDVGFKFFFLLWKLWLCKQKSFQTTTEVTSNSQSLHLTPWWSSDLRGGVTLQRTKRKTPPLLIRRHLDSAPKQRWWLSCPGVLRWLKWESERFPCLPNPAWFQLIVWGFKGWYQARGSGLSISDHCVRRMKGKQWQAEKAYG